MGVMGIVLKLIGYLLVIMAVRDAWKEFRSDSGLIKRVYFSNLLDWLWAFLMVVGVIGVVIFLSLIQLPQFLRFSWISLISSESKGQNLVTTPISSGSILIILIFWVVFTFCLPYLAKIEEVIFRSNVTGPKFRIIKSISFGLVHMVMGIPFYIAIILIFVGYLYSCKYMVGFRRGGDELGLEASTSLHGKYNFIIITIGCLLSIISLLYGVG